MRKSAYIPMRVDCPIGHCGMYEGSFISWGGFRGHMLRKHGEVWNMPKMRAYVATVYAHELEAKLSRGAG